ncbi:MAG: DUF58 domain-containing protein [Chloroflexi bacterium]|nr:DUF58 domain-containing protein [Chloroflexota bacterium]
MTGILRCAAGCQGPNQARQSNSRDRTVSKRTIGILILLAVVAFYTLGTGFPFFFRFLYVISLVLVFGLFWAWINLRGLEVRLSRLSHRGQVGGYLEGQIQVTNRFRFPKSWLEVRELSDIPGYTTGRGIAMVRDQARSWRIQAYLARRGLFETGRVEVTSQDPFGLFRLSRRFLEPQPYVVFPASEPLPDLDPRFAFMPSDRRVARRSDHITPESSGVREYVYGDSYRQIHWPYTARMNNLMVKEFDMGLSAEAWVVLDMQRSSHVGEDPVDNTEEVSVAAAASLITRLNELTMPVGVATNGDQTWMLRPGSGDGHLGNLMEALAGVRARGNVTLERFIYDLQPHLSRFNALTVITPSRRTEWIPALASLRRDGVNVAVVYVDPTDFGAPAEVQSPLDFLHSNEIPVYRVRRGQSLNEALRFPLASRYYPLAPNSQAFEMITRGDEDGAGPSGDPAIVSSTDSSPDSTRPVFTFQGAAGETASEEAR